MKLSCMILPRASRLQVLPWGAGILLAIIAGCSNSSDPSHGEDPPALTCRPAATSCPSGWLLHVDTVCSPPDIGQGPGCSSVGDDICYKLCDTDADCRAAGLASCGSTLTVFHGSDVGTSVRVCSGTAALPECAGAADSGTGGGGGS